MLENLESPGRSFDKFEDSCDGNRADVGYVECCEVCCCSGDQSKIGIGDGVVKSVAEDFQTLQAGEIYSGVEERVWGGVVLKCLGLVLW